MLKDLKKAAEASGFTLHIATSDRNIKDQLNAIVRVEDLPLAMSSWDLDVDLEFNEFGELKNPTTQVTMLLIDKAGSLLKKDLEDKAEEMGELFTKYIRNTKEYLTNNTNVKENPLTEASFTYVPKFGGGQHSGVLGKFKVQMNIDNYCDDVVDVIAPTITSGTVGTQVTNLGGAGQIVYNITATDNVGVEGFTLSGIDSANLTLNGSLVSLDVDPDGNIKDSYTFSVQAFDAAGNISEPKNVTFSVSEAQDLESPVIISGSFGTNLVENTGANQLVYTIIATDNIGVVSYQLVGEDASLLSISGNEVRLIANPDFETKSNYSFGVIATDLRLNSSSVKNVTFEISDVYEPLPFIFTVDSSFTTFDNATGPFEFTMPMSNSDTTYTLVIDDGETTIENVSGQYLITFAKRGFNTIKVFSDSLTGWSANSTNDARKIRGISQFGTFASDYAAFRNCVNLEYITATDCDFLNNNITVATYIFGTCNSLQYLPSTLTLSSATNGNQSFIQNYGLTHLPDGMTLNNLQNGFRMFRQSALVDLPEGMKLSSLTNGTQMFLSCVIDTDRYSQLLIDMESTNPNSNVIFGGGDSKYNAAGEVARNLLIARGWTITDGGLE